MNIRKRLAVSNTLMAVVPAAIGLVVGAVVIGAAWVLITSSLGLDGNIRHTEWLKSVLAQELTEEGSGTSALSSALEAALKMAAVIAAGVLVVCVVASVVVANRFLSSFVLRHMTDPLDQLVEGVRQIRDGNLEYRLPTGRSDEFAPVFADFNDMAARLGASVERDRALEEQRRSLVAGLSHDLRSPLTSIQAYVEGLQDGIAATPEAQRRYLRTIQTKAEEMRRLLGQITTVANLDAETNNPPGDLHTGRLDQAVRSWVAENSDAYHTQGASIRFDGAPTIAAFSTELMERIMTNLLDNCVKYAKSSQGECQVYVHVLPGGGPAEGSETASSNVPSAHQSGCAAASNEAVAALGIHGARLIVSDDGPGVVTANLPHLFNLFFRCDEARANSCEGSGIGLAVVAQAAERMGCHVQARNGADGGLAIELQFPPTAMQAADDMPEASGAAHNGQRSHHA